MSVVSVTVNYKTADLALRAVEAVLLDLEPLGGRAIIVENDSRDGSYERLCQAVAARGWSDRVTVIAAEKNGGFGAGNNIAFRHALSWETPPEYFYLLNPDARPDPGAVRTLVEFMNAHPGVGMAGSRVRHEDGNLRLSAFRFPGVLSELESGLRLGVASRLLERWRVWAPAPQRTCPVDWVSGASVLMRREMLEQVGLFDENFFLYFEETDLCLRALRAGWPTWYVVESEAEHIGQVSTGMADSSKPRPSFWFESRRYYLRKSHGRLRLWAANAAFVGAFALWRARRRVQNKPDVDPPNFLGDFVRHNLPRRSR
jgi:hypothetical protein